MTEHRRLNGIAAVIMAFAVFLAGMVWIFPESFRIAAFDKNRLSYEKAVFDKERVVKINIDADEDAFSMMLDNATQEEYINCDITVNGVTVCEAGIRPKGNSSLNMVASGGNNDRFSFKIEFDHFIKGQTLLGLDKLTLNNMTGDATYMKEYLSYEVMSFIGVETPLYAFAEITVNEEPWGFYLAVEAVEDSFLSRVFGDEGGQLYKPEGMGMRGAGRMNEFIQNMEQGGSVRANGGTDLKYSGDDLSGYSSIFDNAVFKPNDEDMMRVIEAIRNLNAGTELEKYVDVDAVLRYFAANTALVNLDSYVSGLQHNYYLYENNGMISILPWDFNLAFAGFQAGDASAAVNFPVDTPVSGAELSERPLIGKLLEVGEYKEQYHEMLKEIAEGYFKSGLFDDTIEKLDLLINNYVKNDRDAFFTYEQYEGSLPVLARFGSLRADSILAQLGGDMPSTAAGQKAEPEKLVEVQGLYLQAMGTQGGGMKGVVNFEMTGDIPAGFAGNAEGGRLAGDRKLPQGQLPQGQLPQGQLPQGQLPQGQLPQGQLPEGQLPQGNLPQGQFPQGQLPEGQQSRLPRDQAAQMPGVQPGMQNDGGKISGSTYIAEAKAGIVDSLSIPLIIVSAVTAALGILFAAQLGKKRYI